MTFLELDCCGTKFSEEMVSDLDAQDRKCFNIGLPGGKCHSFTRSDSVCTKSGVREQINANTAFVDGSQVYGSDEETAAKLRGFKDGLLKTNDDPNLVNHLPTRRQCGFTEKTRYLFTGDSRSSVQPALTATHTLFLGEHNRIAKELKLRFQGKSFFQSLSDKERDEFLYQESRKIVGAELQKITYKDYIPPILGTKGMKVHQLEFDSETRYDPTTDPSLMNEFATVAFRFGHSQIADDFRGFFWWPLENHLFGIHSIPDEFVVGNGGTNWMRELTGAAKQSCPKVDLTVTDKIRNHFDHNNEDVIARNIQRGRDHGIPDYGTLRKACNMSSLNGTKQPKEISAEIWRKILETYDGNTNNIDPYTGGLAEEAEGGGIVGPLFSCIIGEQFRRIMVGDRFFFSHRRENLAVGLPDKTKKSILKRTLGDIICDNTNARGIQKDVFKKASRNNPVIPCGWTRALDFDGIVKDILG